LKECHRILCPGPSLKELKEVSGKVVAVNRAVKRIDLAIDYWLHLDLPTHPGLKSCWQPWKEPSKVPLGIVYPHYVQQNQDLGYKIGSTIDAKSAEQLGVLNSTDWIRCSALAAIAWCLLDGCEKIEIYGMDMAGIKYFDGGNIITSDRRWRVEAELMEKVMAEFPVVRVGI
jgi:hypothetical protein